MDTPNYNSPAALRALLERQGLSALKQYGQNFMINGAARERLIDLLDIREGTEIWEVGAGLGAMTRGLLSRNARVKAFEIDRGFVHFLHGAFANEIAAGALEILEGNVLKLWAREYFEGQPPERVFGNLPYNIGATFIADTVAKNAVFDRCVFVVQKEIADRMAAKPGAKSYSAFSVLCQARYDVQDALLLGPKSFWPEPRVMSRAVVMTARRVAPLNPLFFRTVRALFSSRRRTILNNVRAFFKEADTADIERLLSSLNISGTERAENLSVEQFESIAEAFDKMINSPKEMPD